MYLQYLTAWLSEGIRERNRKGKNNKQRQISGTEKSVCTNILWEKRDRLTMLFLTLSLFGVQANI